MEIKSNGCFQHYGGYGGNQPYPCLFLQLIHFLACTRNLGLAHQTATFLGNFPSVWQLFRAVYGYDFGRGTATDRMVEMERIVKP